VEPGEFRLGSRTWIIGRRPFRHHENLSPGGTVAAQLGSDGRIARLQDESGRRLSYIALEPELIASFVGTSGKDRLPVNLDDIPEQLVAAVLSIEDQRFFEHHGLDVIRIGAATLANLRAGRVVQGGSTLSQQLAKNLYLSPRRSLIRKAREAAMALTLEMRHSKEEILQAYLNEVYLGQDGGLAVHGVARAAQYYLGKDVSTLDLGESALLAGLIRGPNLYSPFRRPQAAKQRRDLVLKLMLEQGAISQDEFESARQSPLRLRRDLPAQRSARYFIDFVREHLRASYGADAVQRGGLAVFTTLDMQLQRSAEQAVRDGLAQLEAQYAQFADSDAPLQAAVVVTDPRNGDVLAIVGGRDYGVSQFNRAVQAQRQPGSAFKPIVALAALSRSAQDDRDGQPLTLASVLEDERLVVETPQGPWEPVNYDRRFRGSITLRQALERSLNVPFARLGLKVGPERIAEAAELLGIASPMRPVPSLALGSSEITPLELTRAYGVLAAGGFRAEQRTVLGVLDRDGNVIHSSELAGEQVYDPAEVYLVTSALRGAVERGTGRALRALGFHGEVAAKSGTTNDWRDGWFIGYTPTLVVGVWVGFDDARSMRLTGSRAALPIFARFISAAVGSYGDRGLYGRARFSPPSGLEVKSVNQQTGLLAGPGCSGRPELFLEGTAPTESCSRFWRRWLRADDRSGDNAWREALLRLLERRVRIENGRVRFE
jgi:penicillin-binding protein 1B